MANNWNPNITGQIYASVYGRTGGAGTKEDPKDRYIYAASKGTDHVLGAGLFVLSGTNESYIWGQGIEMTSLDVSAGSGITYPRALTLKAKSGTIVGPDMRANIANCCFEVEYKLNARSDGYRGYNNCIFKIKISESIQDFHTLGNCTFVEVDWDLDIHINKRTNALYQQCSIFIDSAAKVIDVMQSRGRKVFSDCLFKIGNETEFTPLEGANLNQAFVNRCASKGIVIDASLLANSHITNGECTSNGIPIKGSSIQAHSEFLRLYFGYTPLFADPILVREKPTANAYTATDSIKDPFVNITDDSITLLPDVPSDGKPQRTTSTWIVLDGQKSIKNIDINHNLPIELGVITATQSVLHQVAKVNVEIEKNYVIKSNDLNEATIMYNGVVYSSNLSKRNNIFRSKALIANWTNATSNTLVYEVIDLANAPTIDIRVTNTFTSGNITSGNLQNGWWYMVEPDILGDLSGRVIYGRDSMGKDISYPPYASFLAKDNKPFAITDSCHLRRIIQEDESINPFVTVAANNPTAVYKNAFSSQIVLGKDGKMVGSAHAEYEKAVSGENGQISIIKNVFGSLAQIRVGIMT